MIYNTAKRWRISSHTLRITTAIVGGLFVTTVLFLTIAQSVQADSRQHIEFRSFGNKDLCSALIFDEFKEKEVVGDVRILNANLPDGSQVVSLKNVDGTVESNIASHQLPTVSGDAFVEVSEFDFLNRGSSQRVYHLSYDTHANSGSMYVVTDLAVPEDKVALAIRHMDFTSVAKIAGAGHWYLFSGDSTFYKDASFTETLSFEYADKTHLLFTGTRPGPIAIVEEPLPDGKMKNQCFFYSIPRKE